MEKFLKNINSLGKKNKVDIEGQIKSWQLKNDKINISPYQFKKKKKMKFNFSKKDVKDLKKNHFILKKKVFNFKELKKFEDEFTRISTKIKNNRDIHFFLKEKKKLLAAYIIFIFTLVFIKFY